MIRGAPNITVLLSEKDREKLYEYLEKSCSYADFCNNYITPDDGKFAELSKILDVSREFYKAFFMDVVKNKRVDEGAFNKIIGPFLNAEMKFLTRSDPFHPKLGWQFHFKSITIQDYIEYYEIIRPGLDQEDDTFAMVNRARQARAISAVNLWREQNLLEFRTLRALKLRVSVLAAPNAMHHTATDSPLNSTFMHKPAKRPEPCSRHQKCVLRVLSDAFLPL